MNVVDYVKAERLDAEELFFRLFLLNIILQISINQTT